MRVHALRLMEQDYLFSDICPFFYATQSGMLDERLDGLQWARQQATT